MGHKEYVNSDSNEPARPHNPVQKVLLSREHDRQQSENNERLAKQEKSTRKVIIDRQSEMLLKIRQIQ